jgi:NADPH:quinone reductase-like Zn-dependent oxidoreductase
MQPVIDSIFEFADAAAAFSHLAEGKRLGKLLIRIA